MPSSGFSAANRFRIEASTGMWRSAHSTRASPESARARSATSWFFAAVVIRLLPVSSHGQRKGTAKGQLQGAGSPPSPGAKYRGMDLSGLFSRERGLEAVDRLHRRRIDAPQDRQVDGDEVTEQDQRQQPLDRVGAG